VVRPRTSPAQAPAADPEPSDLGDPAPPPRLSPREKRLTTINLGAEQFAFLEKRGARSDRAHGTFNRSKILRRKVDLFSAVLERSNPLRTREFPDRFFRFIQKLVPMPWDLTPDEIAFFDHYLANRPEFEGAVRAAKIDSKDLLARLAQLSFPERVALVDLLEQHLAPAVDSDGD